MDDSDLVFRLHRIYAAANAVTELDLSKIPAKEIRGNGVMGFIQDFAGTMSPSEMANAAHSLIQKIASLKDHLRRWASENGQTKTEIDNTFDASAALKIIQDLFDNDKHSGTSRSGGHSRQGPRLSDVGRTLRMTTEPRKGARMVLTLGGGGVPVVTGSGTSKVIITSEVLASSENNIGDFYDVAVEALKAWEELASKFGILSPSISHDVSD